MKASKFSNNHLVLTDENSVSLQSYNTIVVRKENGKIFLDEKWNYSSTTAKNVYKFLYEYCHLTMNKKETLKFIENGAFEIKNLNE